MDVHHAICAGLDVHRDTVVASIRRAGAKRDQVETRTFETYADGLRLMVEWLDANDVQVVGMESTGVYFKPVLQALRQRSPNRVAWVVNAAAVKQVPGRKSDVNDSAWLSKLVMHGLVRPSFIPASEQEELRMLTRYRARAVEDKTRLKNRIIKVVEASGLKLASVCSDVLGTTGRAILDAVCAGEKTPEQMAELARTTLQAKRPLLVRALATPMPSTTRWLLRLQLDELLHQEQRIAAVDEEIRRRLIPKAKEVAPLREIYAFNDVAIATVVAELGTDMSVFATADHAASWAGFAPGSNESAGKHGHAPARKGNPHLRTALVQVAQLAGRNKNSPWHEFFVRLARRPGGIKKAIFAVAHKLLIAAYHTLREGVFRPPTPRPQTPQQAERAVQRALGTLRSLGFEATLQPLQISNEPSSA